MLLLVRLLAVIGVLAVLVRAGRALLSLLRGGVDMFLARDLHEVLAQRGDLTGMQEAVTMRRTGRQRRTAAAARLSFWVGLLIVPNFTPWPAQLCAAYTVFWLFPRSKSGNGMRAHMRVKIQ
jgi:hypothetical protein